MGEAEPGRGPTQPNRRWGRLRKGGGDRNKTRRLCAGPGRPQFLGKARNIESRVVRGTEEPKGPRWCPLAGEKRYGKLQKRNQIWGREIATLLHAHRKPSDSVVEGRRVGALGGEGQGL